MYRSGGYPLIIGFTMTAIMFILDRYISTIKVIIRKNKIKIKEDEKFYS